MVQQLNTIIYAILYINVDTPDESDVLGVYTNKEDAILKLIEKANFREKNGELTYYMEPTDKYASFESLKTKVSEDMELKDLDVYRIVQLRIN